MTDQELEWKRSGTESYQQLTRRCLATMKATAPLAVRQHDKYECTRVQIPQDMYITGFRSLSPGTNRKERWIIMRVSCASGRSDGKTQLPRRAD